VYTSLALVDLARHPKRCRHFCPNATLFILFSRPNATLSCPNATLSCPNATLFNQLFYVKSKLWYVWYQSKTILSDSHHFVFVVRGIEPSPSATALQTSSSYLVRASSLFLPSLLSLILQAAVDAVSHFFTSSPRLPTVGRLFFLSLIIYQQYFTTCSQQL